MSRKLLLVFIFSLFCLATYSQELEEPNLYVFVGEKLLIEEFEPEQEKNLIVMDALFKAHYKVIKEVYNSLPTDTITFLAADHFGMPSFSNFEHVLLYVTKTKKGYVHEKYLYSPLYKTENDAWAAPYEAADYNHSFNKETLIEPIRIEWGKTPSFEAPNLPLDRIKESFPEPYYQIEGRTVTAIYGNYVQELFQLKKNGYLKARGYFK